MRFRKKPVVIEAKLYDGGKVNTQEILDWMDDAVDPRKPGAYVTAENKLAIPTLEGTVTADLGDWVIKGVKGEFYPCKPDIFEATYDRVEDS